VGTGAQVPDNPESAGSVQRADEFEGGALSGTKMPEYLQLGVLKQYADGFEAFLGSEGQFTAEEFVQWCGSDECLPSLQDSSHALAVGIAIVGQNFFEMVDGGNRLKIFDDKSDAVWRFTGQWAGNPVQWLPECPSTAKLDEPLPLSPSLKSVEAPLPSSPAQRMQSLFMLDPSPAKSAMSLDVIDDVWQRAVCHTSHVTWCAGGSCQQRGECWR
jgi:hypothetical protein